MLSLNPIQKTFIIIAICIVALIIVLILFFTLRKVYQKKKYKETFGKTVYKVALYGDYYLINDFIVYVGTNKGRKINHILFGDKYVYVIMSRFYDGNLKGNEKDASLYLINKDGHKAFIDNPLLDTYSIVKRVSIDQDIPLDLLVGITLVNNDAKIDIDETDKYNYIIPVNKLETLVNQIEKRNVPNIKPDELQRCVKAFDEANRKRIKR